MKPTTTQAYEKGFAQGRSARDTLQDSIDQGMAFVKSAYPRAAYLDFAAEVLKLDAERMANPPNYTRFPEARGWPDLVVAERQGFRDGSGCGDLEIAFKYTWFWMIGARFNSRYIGNAPGTANCTAVFIRDSVEGGPLYGRNWDVLNDKYADVEVPRRGPDGKPRVFVKGVSCATMCDEEPQEIFPLTPWDVMPWDCRKLPDVMEFLKRYCEFSSGCNGIIVDEELNSVAFEKSNCRMAFRHTHNGTAAVTACAQLIPEMKEFREKCHRKSLELRGFDEGSPDWQYWSGAELRYKRLLQLVDEAAARGATLRDMGSIVTDHAVPHPAHVCVAGESCHPELVEGEAEWTMRSRAAVLHGPNRRTLFWRVEGQTPCYGNPPFLIPGEGVGVKPEWLEGTRPLPPAPAGPVDELKESYRQYEFDWVRVFD